MRPGSLRTGLPGAMKPFGRRRLAVSVLLALAAAGQPAQALQGLQAPG